MLLVDSHCHLDSLDYKKLHQSVADVLLKARERNVKFVLCVATTLEGFEHFFSVIGERNDVAFSCGAHPLNIDQNYDMQKLKQLCQLKKVIALGETGLDYHYSSDQIALQKKVFREHIIVGCQLNKPVIVHTRDAFKDTINILKEENARDCGGVLHCFTEDKTAAQKLLDLGFYISFSGIVTFRNASELRDVVRYIPLDKMLIETDSPYLAPVPYRGKENQPAYVREIAEYIAELKNVNLEKLADTTTSNFIQLFHLSESIFFNIM